MHAFLLNLPRIKIVRDYMHNSFIDKSVLSLEVCNVSI